MREQTQLKKLKIRKNSFLSFYPLISFVITLLCMLFLYWRNGIRPIGQGSMLSSDLKEQYATFLVFWKKQLASIDPDNFISSLTYSKSRSLGNNMMGTIGYYLISPINIVLFFFRSRDIGIAVAVIMLLKLSFASSFMCMFLERRESYCYENAEAFKNRSKLPIILGVVYSFTAFSIIFIFNIMWFDGYYLLPLLLYFLEGYIRDGKYKGLVVSLIVLFLSNYYIAYMVGIFSFVYLMTRLLVNDISLSSFIHNRKSMYLAVKYVVLAVVCAVICAVVLIPVAMNTLSFSDPTEIVGRDEFSFTAVDILEQLFLGSSGDFSKLANNMPFFFSSILVNLSIVVYFMSEVFDRRIKRIRLILLGVGFCLFFISKLDVVCQAFDYPNWFCHRYSFVFYPFFFIFCLDVIRELKRISNKDIIRAAIILSGLLVIVQSLSSIKMEEQVILINFCTIAFYAVILILLKKDHWGEQLKDMPKILPAMFYLGVIIEVAILNTALINQSRFIYALNDEFYASSIDAIEDIGEVSNQEDLIECSNEADYYRCEYEDKGKDKYKHDVLGCHLNIFANVDGVSFFNTSVNRRLVCFFKQLGYWDNYNYAASTYNYAMPDTDAFLSLKHVITEPEYSLAESVTEETVRVEEKRYSDVVNEVTYRLYRNDNVLPLAFLVNNEAMNFDFYALENRTQNKNYFTFQDEWYHSMFPNAFNRSMFVVLDEKEVEGPIVKQGYYFVGEEYGHKSFAYNVINDSLGSENVKDYIPTLKNFAPYSDGFPVIVSYNLKVPQSGELYMNLASAKLCNTFKVFVDGEEFIEYSSSFSQITRVGYYEEGSEVEVSIVADEGFSLATVNFAIFDYESFDSQFDKLDTSAVNVIRYTDGYAELSVDTSLINEEDSTVLTTIPYDKGWSLYIDGKQAEISVYQNALIAIELNSEGNRLLDGGVHSIELRFKTPGIELGTICSIVGLVLLTLIGVYDVKRISKRHK